jgi:hypothetical protein
VRPKNIRIRIPNTACNTVVCLLIQVTNRRVSIPLSSGTALSCLVHYFYGCRWCPAYTALSAPILLELVSLSDRWGVVQLCTVALQFESQVRLSPSVRVGRIIWIQRYTEITHDPLLFNVAQEYFDCPQRDSPALHYIEKRGERGVCTLVLCSLATVASCIDLSVRIVTKSPKVGPLPLLTFSITWS